VWHSLAAIASAAILGLQTVSVPLVGHGPTATTAALAFPALQRVHGNITASVPAASFGQSDGAPAALFAGKSYRITVAVWLSAASDTAVVTVAAGGHPVARCSRVPVRSGITKLLCDISAGHADDAHFDVAVSMRASNGRGATRQYARTVM
jgi:hypothetical protein